MPSKIVSLDTFNPSGTTYVVKAGIINDGEYNKTVDITSMRVSLSSSFNALDPMAFNGSPILVTLQTVDSNVKLSQSSKSFLGRIEIPIRWVITNPLTGFFNFLIEPFVSKSFPEVRIGTKPIYVQIIVGTVVSINQLEFTVQIFYKSRKLEISDLLA